MAHNGDERNQGGGDTAAPAFDFAAVLAIADALPMALAYVDSGLRYRFVNQALFSCAEYTWWRSDKNRCPVALLLNSNHA